MVETAKQINWLPKWGLDRELDWLKNMSDWLISKKRFWGLALPIYEDTDGSFIVIGSREQLQELAVEGWSEFDGHTPHRPWIDQVKIKSPKTGAILSRIPDVGNPWLDAGIVPFSTMPEEWFPADFITESFPGQFKNWFYALIAMSTALKSERPVSNFKLPVGGSQSSEKDSFKPFRTVLGFGTVRDEKGQEMHKSKGNSIEFNSAAEEIGAESMRWQYVTANPELNLNFGFGPAKEIQRRFFLIWWNVYNFFVTYADLDGWEEQGKNQNSEVKSDNVLDAWILSRLNGLVTLSSDRLMAYDMMTPSRALEQFVVGDLSQWYIRRSRDRVGPSATDKSDKEAFYQTAYYVLLTILRLGAPYLPFFTDTIYRNLTDGQSVHLSDWPQAGASDASLEVAMGLARQVVEAGHAQREARQLKLKQPLQKAIYMAEVALPIDIELLIAAELNVLSVEFGGQADEIAVRYDEVLTDELRDMGQARQIIRAIQAERKKAGVRLDDRVVVTLPDWPASQEAEIKRQTLATELVKGDAIKVELRT
jgi:isoleucyl-tRNA synthetase